MDIAVAIPLAAIAISVATLGLGWNTLRQKTNTDVFHDTMESMKMRMAVLEKEIERLEKRIAELEEDLHDSERDRRKLLEENMALLRTLAHVRGNDEHLSALREDAAIVRAHRMRGGDARLEQKE